MASGVSANILNGSKDAVLQILPDKSQSRYILAYQKFLDWQKFENTHSFQEEVLLAYFCKAAETFAPSTLWGMYSMLKSTINYNQNVDISKYSRLLAFLKKKSDGFTSKKSNVFSAEQIHKFLMEAPDREYLAIKAVMVFAVCGSCRADELSSVTVHHVKDSGSDIIVRIPDSKTKVPKVFPITGSFGAIVRQYMQLRPQRSVTDRFFLEVREGKCTQQYIGKQVIAQMPKQIALFLKLEDSGSYTSHSLRRTSTTILIDTGSGFEAIKRPGVRKASTVGKIVKKLNVYVTCAFAGYIQDSMRHKRQIVNTVGDAIQLGTIGYEFNKDDLPVGQTSTKCTKSTSDRSDVNDYTELKRHHPTNAPRRRRKKRPKRQKEKEIDWYDEECLAQIKLTTDMFKRFSKLNEEDKMKMLSEFSMHRVELFQKYFAAMNTVAINPTNTPMTTATPINTSTQNGSTANPHFVIVKVNSLVNTNDMNEP